MKDDGRGVKESRRRHAVCQIFTVLFRGFCFSQRVGDVRGLSIIVRVRIEPAIPGFPYIDSSYTYRVGHESKTGSEI